MKKINYLFLPLFAFAFFSLVSCGDDGPETPAYEMVKDRFSATWVVDATKTNQVLFQSEDRTDSYANFALTVTAGATGVEGGNYSTTLVDEPDPWPSSGSWTFTNVANITDPNASSFSVTRADGVVIQVSGLTETQVVLEFTYDQSTHAQDDNRIKEVDGVWKFTLTKQ